MPARTLRVCILLYFKASSAASGEAIIYIFLKGALSGQRQFLATQIPLKMMKNVFISP